jgi:hypothetical protein
LSLESDGGMTYWQGKTEKLGEKPVPVPLCPPKIPHGLTRVRTRASAVRGWRLTIDHVCPLHSRSHINWMALWVFLVYNYAMYCGPSACTTREMLVPRMCSVVRTPDSYWHWYRISCSLWRLKFIALPAILQQNCEWCKTLAYRSEGLQLRTSNTRSREICDNVKG